MGTELSLGFGSRVDRELALVAAAVGMGLKGFEAAGGNTVVAVEEVQGLDLYSCLKMCWSHYLQQLFHGLEGY